MGKSKKTLALVMALVMAFTIVPFGAWYGFKAAAEAPTQNASGAYVPATELKDGQAYLVVSKTGGVPTALIEDPDRSDDNDATQGRNFYENTRFDATTEKLALWTYNVTNNGYGVFSNNAYGTERYLNYHSNEHKSYTTTSSADNDSTWARFTHKGDNRFTVSGKNYYLDFNGQGSFVRTSSERELYFYTLPNEDPDTINLPITIRDLHGDHILVDHDADNNEIFNLSSSSGDTKVNNEETVQIRFLNLAGECNGGYRTGLTQENLNSEGELQYSPYVVIYVAHALRATFSGGGRGARNMLVDDNPLGNALTSKYTRYWKNVAEHFYKQKLDENKNELENYLYSGHIKELYDALDGPEDKERKAQVNEFFNNCTNYDSDAARTAVNNISGLSVNSREILYDYWKTIDHADDLTYENIVNLNPRYETGVIYQAKDKAGGVDYSPVTYNYNGASLMDTAWYLLHHFFKDSDTATTALTRNVREDNIQVYSETVSGAAPALQLKKVVKADGNVTYVYDSAFESNWGDAKTPISNKSLEELKYQSSKDDNFTPIDGICFGNSANLDGSGNHGHNYGLSLHGNGKFIYHASDNLYFDFVGDDDVFLYINNKRVDSVDLGGTHTNATGRVDLEAQKPGSTQTWAKYLELEEGGIYDFDFFYMERNPTGSNLRMETNIKVSDSALVPQKKAYDKDGNEYAQNTKVTNNTEVFYTIGVNNFDTIYTGATLNNLVLEDKTLGITLCGDANKVILPDNLNLDTLTLNYAKVDATGKFLNNIVEPVQTKDPATIAKFISDHPVGVGEALFATGIGYTMKRSEHPSLEFTNTFAASATAYYGDNNEYNRPVAEETTFTLKMFDIKDKVYVLDFINNGSIKYNWTDIFDGADEQVIANITPNNTTGDKGGKIDFKKGEHVTYTPAPNTAMNAPENFTFDISVHYNGTTLTDTKTVTFAPANNVYYDASFDGIKLGEGWSRATNASGALTGRPGTDFTYGNTDEEVNFKDNATFLQGDKATAYFTFTGEGYSLYMDTDAESGKMTVTVQKLDKDGNVDKTVKPVLDMMDIHSNEGGNGTYKNVPVSNHEKLPGGYGTYQVNVTLNLTGGKTAYLNGIRVYNPLGNDTTGIYIDSEQNAEFVELRDNLVKTDKITVDSVNGALYIDGKPDGTSEISDYMEQGARNEVRLNPGCSIAFALSKSLGANGKVDVSARSLDGTAVSMNGEDITSTLDMYYNITAKDGIYVIENTSETGVLALTNLKITNANGAEIVVNQDVATRALRMLNAPVAPETPEEPETPSKPQNPIQKFFNDVKNFFNKLFGKH